MENLPDIIFTKVLLEGNDTLMDVIISGDYISSIKKHPSNTKAVKTFNCEGMLLSPPFIDPHQHLDCAYMMGDTNKSGTLAEAIKQFSEIKRQRSKTTIKNLAEKAILEGLFNGTCYIRTHVDADSLAGLKHTQSIIELKRKYSGCVDLQIVACMEYPLEQEPDAEHYLREALDLGADLIGGIPEVEPTEVDASQHIELIFRIAKDYDVDIDMHIDETLDPSVRTLEMLAEKTMEEDYQGRVTAGHACALAAYEEAYARKVIDMVAEAEINIITNPLTNLYLQGRKDGTPIRRGITLVKELINVGVNVSCGLDDNRNLFLPYGQMNMMEVVLFTSLTAHLTTEKEIQLAFDMPRFNAAKILGLGKYGIEVGGIADFIILPVENVLDAIRTHPAPRYVVSRGQVIAETRLRQTDYLNTVDADRDVQIAGEYQGSKKNPRQRNSCS